jgi:hypothetical protein
MADSGALNRLGFGRTGVFPTSSAAGQMSKPLETSGQYSNELFGNFKSGTVSTLLYPANHHSDNIYETKYFKMRGMDHNTNGLYDTWIVYGIADSNGTYYTGSLVTPLRDIIVVSKW